MVPYSNGVIYLQITSVESHRISRKEGDREGRKKERKKEKRKKQTNKETKKERNKQRNNQTKGHKLGGIEARKERYHNYGFETAGSMYTPQI